MSGLLSKPTVHVHLKGPMGSGKTLIDNILRVALSDDPMVEITFHESVGRITDSTIQDMELKPMQLYITEEVTP